MVDAIVEQHASEAAFLWSLRERALRDPHYDLDDLGRLDERMEAHLDGLDLGGDAAWKICKAALSAEEPGEVFAASVVATSRGDIRGIAHVLDVGCGTPELRRGMTSALGWLPFETVNRILPGLLDSACPPVLQRLGISACALHRRDPGYPLDDALRSDDKDLRERAMRAAGELGRGNVANAMRPELRSEDDACRFSAAWSLSLLGVDEAVPILWDFAARGGRFARRACSVALRRTDASTAAAWVRGLESFEGTRRLSVIAAGMRGDPESVPWLLQCMETPELARVAAESFTMITGANFAEERLSAKPPADWSPGPNDDPEDEDVETDPDENLPWPHAGFVSAWWAKNRKKLAPRTRHLLGRPIAEPWLQQVLRRGYQRQREAAALELALLAPSKSMFEVRAPARRQRTLLG